MMEVHNITGTQNSSTSAAWEGPTSTAELRSSTGQSCRSTPGPKRPGRAQRARKALAALLQYAHRAAIPALASRRRHLQEALRTEAMPQPTQAHLGPAQAHLGPRLPMGEDRRRPPLTHRMLHRVMPPHAVAASPPPGRARPLPPELHRCHGGEGPDQPPKCGKGRATAAGVARASPDDLCRWRQRGRGRRGGRAAREREGPRPSPSGDGGESTRLVSGL
jgi:hypothetical protein